MYKDKQQNFYDTVLIRFLKSFVPLGSAYCRGRTYLKEYLNS